MASIALIALTPDVEAIVQMALQAEGYAVTTHALHAETVECISEVDVDLVVIGGSPLVDIRAFVEGLRAQVLTQQLQVIVISPHWAAYPQDGLIDAGVIEVPLPFELLAFLDIVKRAGGDMATLELACEHYRVPHLDGSLKSASTHP